MAGTRFSYKKAIKWNVILINVKEYENYKINSEFKPITTGDWIRYYRKIAGLSQSALALKLGFKETTTAKNIISDYETNIIKPTKDISIKLGRLFNLKTKYFYDDYFYFLDNAPNILKNYREENNLTLTAAANKVGTSYCIWARWENGYPISRKYFNKLKEIIK